MKILIAEEALQSGAGHWPSYIGGIADGLRAECDEVDILVHREASERVLKRTGGTRWFSRNCWIDPKSQGAVGGVRHNLIFFQELIKWLRIHQSYDWICSLTMRLQHLLAFAMLIRSPVVPKQTRFFLLFVQGFGVYGGAGKPALFPKNISILVAQFCFFLLAPAVRSGRMLLVAETVGMQEELQRFTHLPVTLAPHPVQFSELSKPSTLNVRFSTHPLTITCPGFARYEKGSDLLIEAIKLLLSQTDSDRYRFVLQWPHPFAMPDGSMMKPDTMTLSDSRVEFLNHNLDTGEYAALLARTNCVILPYRRESYHHRVSRVAIEAASLGIPLIYTKSTWSEEVAELAGCGIPIQVENAESVADAVLKAVDKFFDLRKRASDGAEKVRQHYSVTTLRQLLTS